MEETGKWNHIKTVLVLYPIIEKLQPNTYTHKKKIELRIIKSFIKSLRNVEKGDSNIKFMGVSPLQLHRSSD